MDKRELGIAGENEAAGYLLSIGYTIVERNYRTRLGECDIIAYDGPVLVFTEVKARSSDRLGLPCEAVTKRKQRNISQMALVYLQEKGLDDVNVRFDVMEVRTNGERYTINHIKNAFDFMPNE